MPFGLSKATVLGAAGSGGGGEGGTYEWIAGYTVDTAGSINSVSLDTSGATDYQEWFIKWSFLGTNPTDVNVRLNGDNGSNYYSNEWWTYNSNAGANGNSSHDQLRMVWTGGTSAGYASPVSGIISISGGNTVRKQSIETLTYRSYETYSTYGTYDFGTTLRAVSASTISSVTLFAQTGTNYFSIGDNIQLFGVKKTSS